MPTHAPCDANGTPGTLDAGVIPTTGCDQLIADVTLNNTATGSFTVWAWNKVAQKWFSAGSSGTLTGVTSVGSRVQITNWCADYAFFQATAVSAGTIAIYPGTSTQGGV